MQTCCILLLNENMYWINLLNNNNNNNYQARALDVATFGYAENLRAKQWPGFKLVLFRHRNNNTSAENSSNNENTEKSFAFWLSVWWCLEKGTAKEIKNYEPTQLNTLLERSCAEIKNKHG